MATVTLKTSGACAGGGHFTVGVTGDLTATFSAVTLAEYLQIKTRIDALSNRERLLVVLAIHQIYEELTNGQLSAELASAGGVGMTL